MTDLSESPSLASEIIHRSVGGQPLRRIARELGVSRWRQSNHPRRRAARCGESTVPVNADLPRPARRRASKLDAFKLTSSGCWRVIRI